MGTHDDLHSETGAVPGEHPGRDANPIIKVVDLAWLEFEKPDLGAAEKFAHAFGFTTAVRTDEELHLRGALAGTPAVIIRRGRRSRFAGTAFKAAEASDLLRLANATGIRAAPLPESLGGLVVDLCAPDGAGVRVVADTHELPAAYTQPPPAYNMGRDVRRSNSTQRPPRVPAVVERLGHVVLQSTRYRESLDWYLQHLGLIVSDFQYYEGQRDRGPTMSFIRCDRGALLSDHHTLAMALGPSNRYMHSAYQVSDLDALAAGGEHLLDLGYHRSWGIGRHIQGSQIFDYWRDPDGFMVEHFTDGDLFDNTLEPGWAPLTASGLAQWGPAPTNDFLGLTVSRAAVQEIGEMIRTLRTDNEFDLSRLRGLMKVAKS